jgi:hypothetical protein
MINKTISTSHGVQRDTPRREGGRAGGREGRREEVHFLAKAFLSEASSRRRERVNQFPKCNR